VEFIFVNDCTKDGSMNVLSDVRKEYPEADIKVINLERNMGLPQARRAGVEQATGDYILHVDSDDWIEPDMLEILYERAVDTGADMVCCDWSEEYEDHDEVFSHYEASRDTYYDTILALETDAYVWSRLTKREAYNGLEFPTCNMFEDFVITSQLVANCHTIEFVHTPLYHYRRSNASSIRSSADTRKILIQEVRNIFNVYQRVTEKEPGQHKRAVGRMLFAMGYHIMRHNLHDSLTKEQRCAISHGIDSLLPNKDLGFSMTKQIVLWIKEKVKY
jgi:glycosyltransferase involved in cell wall biosynthesis